MVYLPPANNHEPAFYEAIGRFVVAFAIAEVGIDAAGALILFFTATTERQFVRVYR
jgi:hypothetical protein